MVKQRPQFILIGVAMIAVALIFAFAMYLLCTLQNVPKAGLTGLRAPVATSTQENGGGSPLPMGIVDGGQLQGWGTYQNAAYGFSFKYPPTAVVVPLPPGDAVVRVNFPAMVPGTSLSEKYLQVSVRNPVQGKCSNPLESYVEKVETVRLGEFEFTRETGSEGAAGQLYTTESYSTLRGGQCLSFGFVLHAYDPGTVPDTVTPEYDRKVESEVFQHIIASVQFFAIN